MNARKIFAGMIFASFIALLLLPVHAQAEGEGANVDLDKIVITASKIEQAYRKSAQNISIIEKEDIEAMGITDFTEILDFLPSVDIVEYGSAGSTRSVHTRGAASTQVLTLIDGRPINTPRDGLADFNQIPIAAIERVEVLRGPASSLYGASAIGGVINIITRRGKEKMSSSLQTQFGSFNTKSVSLAHGYKIKDADYFLTYEYLASHGHRNHSEHMSNNVNTQLGYSFNNDNRLSVSGGYYNSETESPGPVVYEDLDDRLEAFKKYVDLTYSGKLLEGQNVLLKFFHTIDRFEFTETPVPQEKNTNQAKVYGVDAQVSQTIFEILRTAIGADFQEHRLNSSNSGKHTYNLRGGYFETEIDILKHGSIKFGSRWDKYSNFGQRTSPSIAAHLWIFDTLKLHALAAQSFRAPTFNDLYWPREEWFWFGFPVGGVEGNPNLGPEKAKSYEAGFSTYLFKKFKTDVTFFKTRINDLIEWTMDDAGWWRPQNVNSAVLKGLEAETELISKDWLKANLSYTYLEARNKETKRWLVYRPRHLYKLKLAYSPFPKLETGLTALYKSKRYANASNSDFLKHASILNLHASYKLINNVSVNFEVKNIFDRNYQEEKDYSMPGRAFYGGMKIEF